MPRKYTRKADRPAPTPANTRNLDVPTPYLAAKLDEDAATLLAEMDAATLLAEMDPVTPPKEVAPVPERQPTTVLIPREHLRMLATQANRIGMTVPWCAEMLVSMVEVSLTRNITGADVAAAEHLPLIPDTTGPTGGTSTGEVELDGVTWERLAVIARTLEVSPGAILASACIHGAAWLQQMPRTAAGSWTSLRAGIDRVLARRRVAA